MVFSKPALEWFRTFSITVNFLGLLWVKNMSAKVKTIYFYLV